MNWKTILYRLAVLVTIAVGGMLTLALAINLLVMAGAMPESLDGYSLIYKTTYIFMASWIAGIVSIFIKENWGKILLFSPLYTPTIFAIIYVLIH